MDGMYAGFAGAKTNDGRPAGSRRALLYLIGHLAFGAHALPCRTHPVINMEGMMANQSVPIDE